MQNQTNPKKVEKPENVNGIYRIIVDIAKETAKEIITIIDDSPLDHGKIIMIVGPERSGKSVVALDLAEIVEKKKLKNRRIAFAQPSVDRSDVPNNKIFSRTGGEIKAFSFKSKSQVEDLFYDNEIVVIDEIQFTPYDLQSYLLQEIMLFVERGGVFIGIGLDYTSQHGEFVFTALLKERSYKTFRLSSLCQMCGKKADKYNQRLIDGIPASLDTPALLSPSATVTYEPRCEDCLVIKK